MRRPALIVAALLGLAACADRAPSRAFAARLRAQSTSGEPVAGVRFWADGRALGATAASGELRAALDGREGTVVELSAACPPAFRTDAPERQLVLRRVQTAGGGARAVDLELVQTCEPIERRAALVVLASGDGIGGLPIRVDGEPVGQTGPDGTAHLLLGAAPHASLRVELDTSAHPRLFPHSPVHSFQLEDEDSILLVEQVFAVPVARHRPPARPHPRESRQRPQRIQ